MLALHHAEAEFGKSETDSEEAVIMKKKTFLQKLKFWGARPPGQPNTSIWLPSTFIRFPVVLFSEMLIGAELM